jgi:TPP-dependent pyruvate/acetoin dehydrogenase alpha subunit
LCRVSHTKRWYGQVRAVAEEAIARARRGDGPTLIECETYRFRGHSLADPDELREKEEKEHYAVGRAFTRHSSIFTGMH